MKWNPTGRKGDLDLDFTVDKPTVQIASVIQPIFYASTSNDIEFFENELEGWYTDETLWPKNRDYKTFMEWIEVECHSVVLDTVGGEIYDDEI